MAIKVKQGNTTYWRDGDGALVPVRYIPEDEKRADKLVENVIKNVINYQSKMEKFKKKLESELNEYLKNIANKYDEEWEGNATIYNFSKDKQIDIKISKHITFNEKLQIAKKKIDACIMRWSEGSNKKLVALINKAFKVDKKGEVDAKRILDLRTLNIADKDWQEAMQLITESITIDSTKVYYNFRIKEDGKWKTLSLNFSSL